MKTQSDLFVIIIIPCYKHTKLCAYILHHVHAALPGSKYCNFKGNIWIKKVKNEVVKLRIVISPESLL